VQHDGLCPQGARLTFSLQAALHQPWVAFCHLFPSLPARLRALTGSSHMANSIRSLPLAEGMRPTRNLVLSLRLSLLVCDHAKLNSQDRGERDEADLQQ
jgi:hypothetical protein